MLPPRHGALADADWAGKFTGLDLFVDLRLSLAGALLHGRQANQSCAIGDLADFRHRLGSCPDTRTRARTTREIAGVSAATVGLIALPWGGFPYGINPDPVRRAGAPCMIWRRPRLG